MLIVRPYLNFGAPTSNIDYPSIVYLLIISETRSIIVAISRFPLQTIINRSTSTKMKHHLHQSTECTSEPAITLPELSSPLERLIAAVENLALLNRYDAISPLLPSLHRLLTLPIEEEYVSDCISPRTLASPICPTHPSPFSSLPRTRTRLTHYLVYAEFVYIVTHPLLFIKDMKTNRRTIYLLDLLFPANVYTRRASGVYFAFLIMTLSCATVASLRVSIAEARSMIPLLFKQMSMRTLASYYLEGNVPSEDLQRKTYALQSELVRVREYVNAVDSVAAATAEGTDYDDAPKGSTPPAVLAALAAAPPPMHWQLDSLVQMVRTALIPYRAHKGWGM